MSALDDLLANLEKGVDAKNTDSELFQPEQAGDKLGGTFMAINARENEHGSYQQLLIEDTEGKLWRWNALGAVAEREVRDALARGLTVGWACLVKHAGTAEHKTRKGSDGKPLVYDVVTFSAAPTSGAAVVVPLSTAVREAGEVPAEAPAAAPSEDPFA